MDSIGACAFYDCDNITSISVPEKVTLIQDYCFAGSDSLKKVTLSSESESIGDEAFYEFVMALLQMSEVQRDTILQAATLTR